MSLNVTSLHYVYPRPFFFILIADRAVKNPFMWGNKLFSTQLFGHIAQDVVEVGICWFQLRLNALRDSAIQNKSKDLKQQVCFSTVINHVITGVSDWICSHP